MHEPGGGRAPYIGRPLPRFEDRRLVAGRGRFTDDAAFDGQAHAVFVRSPHAHARIVSIDAGAARALPGVVAVFTADDYAAAGGRGVAHIANPASTYDVTAKAFTGPGLQTAIEVPHLPLAGDRVRYVGEPVVMVIADTLLAAQDAAESVAIDYEPLPAVTDALAALQPAAPLLHDGVPGNLALDTAFGDAAACEAAFAAAQVVVAQTFRNQRIASAQMEPRAAIGAWDEAEGVYTILTGSQGASRIRGTIAACLGVAPERVRAITHDVGGAFGLLSNVYPEQVMVAWAARHVGRPVKWTGDRSQAFLTDYQGRDMVTDARLAFAADGRILALAVTMTGNVGCRPVTYVPLANAFRVTATVYDIPTATVAIRGVLTNTVPTAPFRGAGRPEATFAIERLLDMAARRLGIDRIELRRRNLVRRPQLPYTSATGLVYDSGNFRANMDAAMKLAGWEGFPARRRDAESRGRLAGIGLANYVESPVGAPSEYMRVTVRQENEKGREVEAAGGDPVDRTRPRDDVRAGARRPPRRAARGGPARHRRHRRRAGRRRHPFGPLDAARGHHAGGRLAAHRCPGAPGLRGACRLRRERRELRGRPVRITAVKSEARRVRHCQGHCERRGAAEGIARAADERGAIHRAHPGLPHRRRGVRGGDRSRDRRGGAHALRIGGRLRPADQPADPARAGSRRHRPGRGAGAVRVLHARGGVGAGGDRQLHGLRHAARRDRAELHG
jgi:hypothetical protein